MFNYLYYHGESKLVCWTSVWSKILILQDALPTICMDRPEVVLLTICMDRPEVVLLTICMDRPEVVLPTICMDRPEVVLLTICMDRLEVVLLTICMDRPEVVLLTSRCCSSSPFWADMCSSLACSELRSCWSFWVSDWDSITLWVSSSPDRAVSCTTTSQRSNNTIPVIRHL